ncbi:MAG: hypothetical protein ACYCO3_05430 [Mycobacteriales bacterium]
MTVGLVLTVPALLLLVPTLGGMGAALATLFATVVIASLVVWKTARVVALPIASFLIPTRDDATLVRMYRRQADERV